MRRAAKSSRQTTPRRRPSTSGRAIRWVTGVTSWIQIALLLALAGAHWAVTGARLLVGGLQRARALELVWGIRRSIPAFVAGLFAVGLLVGQAGLILVGAIILAEELYETGALATITRLSERGAA